MQRNLRMKKEIEMLTTSPPHGISCWQKDDKIDHLEAQILGAEGTPYDGGVFKLEIQIPERLIYRMTYDVIQHVVNKCLAPKLALELIDRYPFEPPKVRYVTPIYHPNIDNGGRICLDTLKMPPKGAWKPCLNISTVLTSLQLLMAEPNPEDPLMTDISNEFKYNRTLYNARAKEWTEKYALEKVKLVVHKEIKQGSGSKRKCVKTNDQEGSPGKHLLAMADVTNKRLKPS